jgi:hypothetical protein
MGDITLYRFFPEQNIVHFEDLLKADIGLGRRSMVLKLLLAEEQKLGDYSRRALGRTRAAHRRYQPAYRKTTHHHRPTEREW